MTQQGHASGFGDLDFGVGISDSDNQAEVLIQLSFEKFTAFVELYSSSISLGGMFLQTAELKPVGTPVSVEIKLSDGYRLLQAVGEVAWICPRHAGGGHPEGMAIHFQALDESGRELLLKIIEEQVKSGEFPFDVHQIPPGAITENRPLGTHGGGAAPTESPDNAAAAPSELPPRPTDLEFHAPWGEALPQLPLDILDSESAEGEPPAPPLAAAGRRAPLPLPLPLPLAGEDNPVDFQPPASLPEIHFDQQLFPLSTQSLPSDAAAELPSFIAPEAADLPALGPDQEAKADEASFAMESEVDFGEDPEAIEFGTDPAQDVWNTPSFSAQAQPEPAWEPEEPTLLTRPPEPQPAEPRLAEPRSAEPRSAEPRPAEVRPASNVDLPAPAATQPELPGLPQVRAAQGKSTSGSARPSFFAPTPEPVWPAASPAPLGTPLGAPLDPAVGPDVQEPPGDPLPAVAPIATSFPARTASAPLPLADHDDVVAASDEPDDNAEESAASPRKPSWHLALVFLAVLVIAAAAGYWQRDGILEYFQGPAKTPPDRTPPDLDRRAEPSASPAITPTAGPTEAAIPVVVPTVTDTLTPPPSPATETPPPRRERGTPANRIDHIVWTSTRQGTLITVRANGDLGAARYQLNRLNQPPRELLKITGIVAPYRDKTIEVGSAEVRRIRVGHHLRPGAGSELHIVLDLASAQIAAAEVRDLGDQLEIQLSQP